MIGERITVRRPVDDYGLAPAEDLAPAPDLLPDDVEYDEQGNPVPREPFEFDSDGWAVAPSFENEDQVTFGTLPVSGLRLYNRSVVDLRPDDEVTVRGNVWKVVGDAASWRSPYSGFEGTVVSVARVA